MRLLATILGLALLDSLNPTSITASGYLAITGRARALRIFVLGVYLTYLAFALTLAIGLGNPTRAALAGTPASTAAVLQIGAGAVMLAAGVWGWRRRARLPSHRELGAPSAFALGVLATVMDLPTAPPLIAAVGLIIAARLQTSAELGLLGAYDLVYISPLLAILLLRRRVGPLWPPVAMRALGRLDRAAPALSLGMRAGIGCVLGAHGIAEVA